MTNYNENDLTAQNKFKPTPDEIGNQYAKVFTDFFGCEVKYSGDKDQFHDDDFYQLEFVSAEPFGDIELIEEEISQNVRDVINLAKFGPRNFQATIWLAPEKK